MQRPFPASRDASAARVSEAKMLGGTNDAGKKTGRPHPRRKRPRGRPGGGSEAIIRAVLEAALEELGLRGYASLSIEEVALRAGVNKTSIYRRWPSKGELVRAALLRLRDDEAPLPDTGALETDLLELLRRKTAKMSVPRGRSIVRALMADKDDELAALTCWIRERHAEPSPVFERAIARGELPAGTDTALLLEIITAPVYHRAFILQERIDDTFLRRVIDVVLRGVLVRGRAARVSETVPAVVVAPAHLPRRRLRA
jgi:AcrR family transcriptional regulator